MDGAGSQKAAIMGGSEGASMACMFAATYPERVRSLLIWGAQARWVQASDYPWGMTPEDHEALIRDVSENWPSLNYVLGPGAGLGKDVDPEYLKAVLRYCRAAGSPSAVAAYERMNGEIDIRSILPSIRVPTLVMNRAGDPVAPAAAARDMATRIPGARYVEFPGNTHAIATIEPEKVLAEIEHFITGTRRAEAESVDRILATVLFVDIIGSTERAAELGDAAWRELLESFYQSTRQELLHYRGQEMGKTGDGFLATFDGPARGIRCALAINDTVKRLGLAVRSGLHTGECEVMAGSIGGIAVHTGARVAALAGPGEVFVSRTVKDLVAGSGLQFEPRGVHHLKGVPGDWQLYSLS
jgi:class 3 adenylate cyclase